MAVATSTGTGLLLVGGQAVNLWAELYKKNEPEILELQPFTSRDADWSAFFPIELMREHPCEAVRNFTKYQLKPKF
jgi:hypothetical protein